jgi:hypothetical protein
MRQIADLLREVLRHGDGQGRVQVRASHLPEHLLDELAGQTHLYAIEHAAEAGEGWLAFSEGIEG